MVNVFFKLVLPLKRAWLLNSHQTTAVPIFSHDLLRRQVSKVAGNIWSWTKKSTKCFCNLDTWSTNISWQIVFPAKAIDFLKFNDHVSFSCSFIFIATSQSRHSGEFVFKCFSENVLLEQRNKQIQKLAKKNRKFGVVSKRHIAVAQKIVFCLFR